MQINTKTAHSSNYTKLGGGRDIRYIVIHYTANNGDTVKNNADYFANNANLRASAHYFVYENEVWQSVADKDRAWHCGSETGVYYSPCRNATSIGIELCSRKNSNGRYYFKDATVSNAAALTRELMKKYSVSVENVIRHYDVTHKNCPAPFVENPAQWEAFRAMLTHREDEDEVDLAKFKELWFELRRELQDNDSSDYSAEARQWAVESGLIAGNGAVINGEANYMWADFLTREQLVTVLFRFAQLMGKA